ncbi:MAG: diacylglycerol kinase [Desulfobulbaceae bacterium]|nr:diacylglycerol kinase [Desulfobulbaceae bacterium]
MIENEKSSGTGIKRLLRALGWSWAGLKSAIKGEAAFRQELICCIIGAPLALYLGQSGVERVLLLGSLLLVLIVELLNSAVEAIVDRVGTEHHPLSGQAKDMGSAAVFMALTNVIITWGLILY